MNLKVSIIGLIVLLATVATGFIVYDLLFSKPDHLEGVVIEKIFVPGRMASGDTPYGGAKRSKYFVTHQKEEQWIALVKVSNDTLTVHCHPDHYKIKNVGDVIHFKKYDGHLVHIEYFAHNEEEQ